MRRYVAPFVLFTCAVGALLLLSQEWPAASAAQQLEDGPKWEYAVHKGEISDEDIKQRGEQGWELVMVEPKLPFVTVRTTGNGNTFGSVSYTDRVFYFKRLKQ